MNSNKRIAILVGVIGLLIILLSGSIGYILANINSNNSSFNKSVSTENSKVLKEIKDLKSLYDTKIADKTISFTEMQIQKDSIENLVLALENSKLDASALLKYKIQFKNLESKMKILVVEIVDLKAKKSKIVYKKKAEIVVVENNYSAIIKNNNAQYKKENNTDKPENVISKTDIVTIKGTTYQEEIIEKNQIKVVPKINKYSKIVLLDIKATGYISKSAIKSVESTNANAIDFIKITFSLQENATAKAGEKKYYFQIINSKNNVIGKRITEFFDNESLTYSFFKTVDYNNQSIVVTQDFYDADFEKGYYFVTIYDRDELVGKTSLLLK